MKWNIGHTKKPQGNWNNNRQNGFEWDEDGIDDFSYDPDGNSYGDVDPEYLDLEPVHGDFRTSADDDLQYDGLGEYGNDTYYASDADYEAEAHFDAGQEYAQDADYEADQDYGAGLEYANDPAYAMNDANAAYANDGYAQDGYQDGYVQDDYAQDGYSQDGYAQDNYAQNGYAQDNYARNGYAQNTYAQDGYAQDNYAQNTYAQDNYAQDGGVQGYANEYAQTGYDYGYASNDAYATDDGYYGEYSDVVDEPTQDLSDTRGQVYSWNDKDAGAVVFSQDQGIKLYGEKQKARSNAEASSEFTGEITYIDDDYEEAPPKPAYVSRAKKREEEEDDRGGFGIFEAIVAVAGILLIIGLAGFMGWYVYSHKKPADPHQQFAGIGQQIQNIDLIGGKGIAAIASAKVAAIETFTDDPDPYEIDDPDPVDGYNETDYKTTVAVAMSLTSVQKDLKIKFSNRETSKLVGNVQFVALVTGPNGTTEEWTDDDMDGIIYAKGIDAGKYSVSLKALDTDKYSNYILPTASQTVTVKKNIEYAKVDVTGEGKKESEINVSQEDTKKNETTNEGGLTDTVTWVASSVTGNTYTEVLKSTIPDPLTRPIVVAANFYRTAQTDTPGTGTEDPGAGPEPSETPTPAPETPTPAPETPTPAPETPTPAPATPTPAPTNSPEPTNSPSPVKHTIKFAAGEGGTGSMADVTKEEGSSYTLPECGFTAPEGKVFDKWDKGEAGAKITVTADMTITALWKSASAKPIEVKTDTAKLELVINKQADGTTKTNPGNVNVTIDSTKKAAILQVVSTDKNVATAKVDDTDKKKVVVTAIGKGTAKIMITVDYEDAADRVEGKTQVVKEVEVVVTEKAALALSIEKTEILCFGDPATSMPTLEVTIKNSSQKPEDLTEAKMTKFVADTSDANVAKVTKKTFGAASADGTVKITLTITPAILTEKKSCFINISYQEEGSEVITAKCTLTVKPHPKNDKTTPLLDKDDKPLYVENGNDYRQAVYADYYVEGTKFYLQSGVKYTGWQTIQNKVYYFDAQGKPVTGEQVIQGAKYNFGSDGALLTGNGVLGIDVSRWNGSIDWTKVKNSGVSYVIIRCGYRGSSKGQLIEDPKFTTNIKGAINAGLKVGVYFFTQAVDEVEAVYEASYVIEKIKNYKISYPVFLDVEPSGGRGDKISNEMRTNVCKAFCQTIQNAGYTAGIYANKTWLTEKLDASQLSAYKIWLAQYAAAPTYGGRYDIWQYKSTGSINGISGDVDMNLSYMGY